MQTLEEKKIAANESSKKYYEKNKEKIKEQRKRYREANKEKVKQWGKLNKDERKELNKQYHEANKEKIRERKRQYYEANREKIKQYREANKDERNEKSKHYYEANREQVLMREKIYRHSHREAFRSRDRNRREKLYSQDNQTITPDFIAILFQKAKSCPYCNKKMMDVSEDRRNTKSLDHLIPIAKGGLHAQHNVVICCCSCNSSKNSKSFPEWLDCLDEPHRTRAEKLYIKQYGVSPIQGVLPLVFC